MTRATFVTLFRLTPDLLAGRGRGLAFVGALVVNLVRRLRQVMEAVRLPGGWMS
jgi:hypothetical protein